MTRQIESRDRRSLSIHSLRDLCYVVFRHRIAALLVAVVTFGAFGGAALLLPAEYRSEAALLVKGGRDLRVDPAFAAAGPVFGADQSQASRINSEIEIMKSEPLLARVAEEVGLVPADADSPSARGRIRRERVLNETRENLRAESAEDNDVIHLAYEDSDPDRARLFLATLVELYRERHVEVHSSEEAVEFLASQADELARRVAEREEELRALKLASGIESVDEYRRILIERIAEREAAVAEVGRSIVAAEAQIEVLEEQLAAAPEMTVVRLSEGVPAEAYEGLVAHLYTLRLERLGASRNYTADSRVLRDLDERIAGAEAMLAGETPTRAPIVHGPNENRIRIERTLLEERSNLASLLARRETLTDQHEKALAERDRFHGFEAEMRRLQRELNIATSAYERAANSLESARVDRALENGLYDGVRVVQEATLPAEPAGPHRGFLTLLGLAVAAFLSTGVAFGLEVMDDSLRTPEDVEQVLGVRPVVSIPYTQPAFERHRIPGAPAGAEPIRWWQQTDSQLRDAVSLEEAAWGMSDDAGRTRVLAVTADHKGAGATTVAAHLAESLARQGGGRVLLVDADGSNPTLSDMLGARMSKGLSDGLKQKDFRDIGTLPTPVDGLHLLPVGLAARRLSQGIDPDALLDTLAPLAADFSHVVIDLPPATDIDLLTEMRERCDGLMLVLEANRSRRPAARFLFREVSETRGGELAIVLNKRDFPIPDWLYSRL